MSSLGTIDRRAWGQLAWKSKLGVLPGGVISSDSAAPRRTYVKISHRDKKRLPRGDGYWRSLYQHDKILDWSLAASTAESLDHLRFGKKLV